MKGTVLDFVERYPLSREPLIRLADRAYRLGYPIMDDTTFDELADGVEVEINDNPAADGVAVALHPPMLSQQKTYNYSDVTAICSKSEVLTASLKLDGFAVSLVYEHGVLSYATTRGDGREGLTITNHIIAGVLNIPWILDDGMAEIEKLEIRGEMIIPSSFGDAKHNPRSICVGLFGRNDLSGLDEYEPSFYGYDLLLPQLKHEERLSTLMRLGFDVVPWIICNPSDICAIVMELEGLRESFPCEADGIVFRINDPTIFHAKGSTQHHPKGSIALKFKTDTAVTTVESIDWSEGEKTGKLTPIVSVSPVTLGGCEIRKLNGGTIANTLRVGDKIQITRKGGVIPVILAKL